MSIINKLWKLQKNGQLGRALIYKFLIRTGLGSRFSFETQGVRLRLFPSDMTFEAFKSPHDYRSPDKAFLEHVLKPGEFVVDVGANIGMISIRSAKLVGNSGKVISIEPNPKVAPLCKANVQLNGLNNVTVIQTALGAHEGTISFNCDPCDDCSRVIEKGAGVTVPITRLDKVLQSEPGREIGLLKVDVEGYEFVVLEGATETLKRTRLIYIEVDAKNYSHYGKKPGDVVALLEANGFDTFVCDENGENWRDIKGFASESFNLIGKRRAESARKDSAAVPAGARA
jgi:FkbM family methyltransferase